MNFIRSFPLKWKLITISISILCINFIVIGIYSYELIQRNHSLLTNYSFYLKNEQMISSILAEITNQQIRFMQLLIKVEHGVITQQQAYAMGQQYIRELDRVNKIFDSMMLRFKKEPETVNVLKNIRSRFLEFINKMMSVIRYPLITQEMIKKHLNESDVITEKINLDIERLIKMVSGNTDFELDKILHQNKLQIVWLIFITNFLLILINFFVAMFLYRITNSLSKRIHSALTYTKSIIHSNDFSKRLPAYYKDEFGVLVKNLNHLFARVEHNQVLEKQYQKKLAIVERRTGMADIAASVLHNVGNVLNSLNIATNLIDEKIHQSKMSNLSKLKSLLKKHQDNLIDFFTNDQKGKYVAEYVIFLANAWKKEKQALEIKLKELRKHIIHVNHLIRDQNNLAKLGGVSQKVDTIEFVEEALSIYMNKCNQHNIFIHRDYETIQKPDLDQIKVTQILINLIKNSIESLIESTQSKKRITIRIKPQGNYHFSIIVEDNGVGIDKKNTSHIFTRYFTTKKEGHGVGLHASAISAKELGGTLSVHSAGIGQGASFTLMLPYDLLNESS